MTIINDHFFVCLILSAASSSCFCVYPVAKWTAINYPSRCPCFDDGVIKSLFSKRRESMFFASCLSFVPHSKDRSLSLFCATSQEEPEEDEDGEDEVSTSSSASGLGQQSSPARGSGSNRFLLLPWDYPVTRRNQRQSERQKRGTRGVTRGDLDEVRLQARQTERIGSVVSMPPAILVIPVSGTTCGLGSRASRQTRGRKDTHTSIRRSLKTPFHRQSKRLHVWGKRYCEVHCILSM